MTQAFVIVLREGFEAFLIVSIIYSYLLKTKRTGALPAQLSGGQQQRVAIARSLIHGPKLIVCDEPTSSLDHETGHKVMEILRELAVGRERALIIVTHDARVFSFADRIAKMDDGQIVQVLDSPGQMQQPSK